MKRVYSKHPGNYKQNNSQQTTKFKIIHLNARIIQTKVNQIEVFLEEEKPDFFIFGEHDLDSDKLKMINLQIDTIKLAAMNEMI